MRKLSRIENTSIPVEWQKTPIKFALCSYEKKSWLALMEEEKIVEDLKSLDLSQYWQPRLEVQKQWDI